MIIKTPSARYESQTRCFIVFVITVTLLVVGVCITSTGTNRRRELVPKPDDKPVPAPKPAEKPASKSGPVPEVDTPNLAIWPINGINDVLKFPEPTSKPAEKLSDTDWKLAENAQKQDSDTDWKLVEENLLKDMDKNLQANWWETLPPFCKKEVLADFKEKLIPNPYRMIPEKELVKSMNSDLRNRWENLAPSARAEALKGEDPIMFHNPGKKVKHIFDRIPNDFFGRSDREEQKKCYKFCDSNHREILRKAVSTIIQNMRNPANCESLKAFFWKKYSQPCCKTPVKWYLRFCQALLKNDKLKDKPLKENPFSTVPELADEKLIMPKLKEVSSFLRKKWEDRTPSQKAECIIFQHNWKEVIKSREFCEKHHNKSILGTLHSLKVDSFLNEGGVNFRTLCLQKYPQLCCKYQILCCTWSDTSGPQTLEDEKERTLEPNPFISSASGAIKYYSGKQKMEESLTPAQKMKTKQEYKRSLTQLFSFCEKHHLETLRKDMRTLGMRSLATLMTGEKISGDVFKPLYLKYGQQFCCTQYILFTSNIMSSK